MQPTPTPQLTFEHEHDLLHAIATQGTASRPALRGRRAAEPAAAYAIWNVARVACATPAELREDFGAQGAARLLLARQFAERLVRSRLEPSPRLLHPADIYSWAKGGLRSRVHEELWLLALDCRLCLRSARKLAQGGGFGVTMRVRDVLRAALESSGYGFILVHNHPSGTLEPSDQDLAFTSNIASAASSIGIPLLDHVIVTFNGYRSILNDRDS